CRRGAREPRRAAVPPRVLRVRSDEAAVRARRVGVRPAVEARPAPPPRRAVRSGDREDRRRDVCPPTGMTRLIAIAALVAACQPPAPRATHAAPPGIQFTLIDLVGGWRWLLRADEDGTARVEEEVWRFLPSDVPAQLKGRYVRTVEVRSTDRFVFGCNQR